MGKKISRFYRSLSTRLQFMAIFLSLVGITFGIKSYLHVREVFGETASEVFLNDLWVQIAVALSINAIVALLIYITTIKPLNTINEALRALAENNLDVVIPYTERGDQIGSGARKAKVFQENAKKLVALQKKQLEDEKKAEEEKAKIMNKLAFTFEDGISKVVGGISGASVELENSAALLSSTAKSGNEEARMLAESSQKSLEQVRTVSEALGQLINSINEINSQIGHSNKIANNAFEKGQEVKHIFEDLAASACQIDNIIQLITNISGQINMLAMNATIEASRAGEAGQGFAVVANEVKNLAEQTNQAATKVAEQISGINDKMGNTQTALMEIIDTINQMNEIATSISSGVEKQKMSADEIGTSINAAEETTTEARNFVAKITESSMAVEHVSSEVNVINEQLTGHSKQLKDRVIKFLSNLKETTMSIEDVPEFHKDHEMVTLKQTNSCADAIQLFSQYNIGVLPIVEDDKLVGVFSERDIIKKLEENIDPASIPITEIMTKNPSITLPHEEILGAILSTIRGGYRHLLIADENRKLLSVLSHRDLGNLLWEELKKRGIAEKYTLGDMVELKEVNNLKTLTSNHTVRDAVNLMKSGGFGAVPVVKGSKLEGIITERDVIKRILNEKRSFDTLIAEVMTKNPDTVTRDISLKEIAESDVFKKYRHLLITDKEGDITLQSILSLRDFVEIPYEILVSNITGEQLEKQAA